MHNIHQSFQYRISYDYFYYETPGYVDCIGQCVPQTTVEVSKLLKSWDKGGILKSILGFRV